MSDAPASEDSRPTRPLLRPKDVCEACGITHQVIHRYKEHGLILPAAETPGRHGLFHPDVVQLIATIQRLTRSGYTLRDLREIFFKEQRVDRALGPKRDESAPQ